MREFTDGINSLVNQYILGSKLIIFANWKFSVFRLIIPVTTLTGLQFDSLTRFQYRNEWFDLIVHCSRLRHYYLWAWASDPVGPRSLRVDLILVLSEITQNNEK